MTSVEIAMNPLAWLHDLLLQGHPISLVVLVPFAFLLAFGVRR